MLKYILQIEAIFKVRICFPLKSDSLLSQPTFQLLSALSQPKIELLSALSQPKFQLLSALSQPKFQILSALSQPKIQLLSALSQPTFVTRADNSQAGKLAKLAAVSHSGNEVDNPYNHLF